MKAINFTSLLKFLMFLIIIQQVTTTKKHPDKGELEATLVESTKNITMECASVKNNTIKNYGHCMRLITSDLIPLILTAKLLEIAEPIVFRNLKNEEKENFLEENKKIIILFEQRALKNQEEDLDYLRGEFYRLSQEWEYKRLLTLIFNLKNSGIPAVNEVTHQVAEAVIDYAEKQLAIRPLISIQDQHQYEALEMLIKATYFLDDYHNMLLYINRAIDLLIKIQRANPKTSLQSRVEKLQKIAFHALSLTELESLPLRCKIALLKILLDNLASFKFPTPPKYTITDIGMFPESNTKPTKNRFSAATTGPR